MIKTMLHLLGVCLLAIALLACSSPEEKAAAYVKNGDLLLQQGSLEKATLEYRNALQINQNLPDAWYGLARIYERKQEWEQVYAALIKIRDTHPEHVEGRIMLAHILLAMNQIDQALEHAEAVLELAPDDARAHASMAAVQFRLGNLAVAQESVEKALALDSGSSEAILIRARMLLAEKKYQDSIAVLDAALQGQPDIVSFYLMKIQAYAGLGDKAAIKAVYKALVKNFPENIAYKKALAQQNVAAGDIDQAEQLLVRIVEDNPDNVDEKLNLVRFKQQHRSVDESVALVQRYIEQEPAEFQYRFALAELYLALGNSARAIDIYQGIITDDEIQPNGLEARNKLALMRLRDAKPAEAKSLIAEVLENDGINENALILRAGIRVAEQQYDDAIVDLRTVLRDNPESTRALALIGQAYTATGSTDLANESYGKAFGLDPRSPAIVNAYVNLLLRGNNPQQADEVLRRSIGAGNRDPEALKLLTQVKLLLGEWDQAEQLAQSLKSIDGGEALSEQALGFVYQGRGQPEQSIDAFRRAHELAPDATRPVMSLVQAYVDNNQVAEARKFLQTIIEKNKSNVIAYLLLGQLSLRENDAQAAIDYLQQAVEINPTFEPGYRGLATIYMRQNRLQDAERILQAGLQQIPGNVTLSINLASVYEGQMAFDKAIGVYETLLQGNPDLIVAKNNLASMLTDYRQDRESHERARQIAAEFRDSSVPQFRDTYAWASVVAGTNLEEAVVILEGIVRENEQVAIYTYHLGEAYRRKGDPANAIAYLDKALELAGPDSAIRELALASKSRIQ